MVEKREKALLVQWGRGQAVWRIRRSHITEDDEAGKTPYIDSSHIAAEDDA